MPTPLSTGKGRRKMLLWWCGSAKNIKRTRKQTTFICCSYCSSHFCVSAEVGKATTTAAVPGNAPCASSSSFRLPLRPLLSFHCTSTQHQTMATKYDRQLRLWGASGQRALGETCIVLINATASGTETLKNLGKCIMCFVRTCTCSAFVVLFRRTHSLNFVLLTIFCSTLCPSSPSRCRCNPCR